MSLVARRYATALIDAADAQKSINMIASELEEFALLFDQSDDVQFALVNPAFSSEQRREMLQVILDAVEPSDMLRRFLELLADRERMDEVVAIARDVRKLADDRAHRVRALVETATPLRADALASLTRALERRTNKSVDVEVQVDPALIGGVRTTIGSQVFDGTIRSQLDGLKETLGRSE